MKRNIAILLCTIFFFVQTVLGNTTIPAAEASKHVGEYGTVEGRVFKVFISGKGNVFLNIGGNYPNQPFAAVVFSRNVSKFPNGVKDLVTFEDKNVLVTGKIKGYRGKPEIIITSPSQIF